MRLTGGIDRGRTLRAPRGRGTRPTAAKVREAVFDILGAPDGALVLDLFAGTGALGVEALSRGAARAVFVEKSRRACAVLRRNLRELGLEPRAAVLPLDVRSALPRLAAAGERFDWVFVDAPYASGLCGPALAQLSRGALLSPRGTVVVEHDARHRPADGAAGLRLGSRRAYGDTELSIFVGAGPS